MTSKPVKKPAASSGVEIGNTQENARLLEVNVQGYRSCRNTIFTVHKQLSAVIGINGSGKTNLLTAIRLLALQARQFSRSAEKETSLNETVITSWFLVNGKRIGYRIRLFLSVSTKNTDEISAASEEWNFHSITKSRAWRSLPPVYIHSKPRNLRYERDIELYERELYFSRRNSRANFSISGYFSDAIISNPLVIECAAEIFDYCRQIKYYGASQFTDPSRCPSSFEIDSDGRLAETYTPNRSHISFLYELHALRKNNTELYEQYEAFISKNELGLISRLTWKEVALSSSVAEVKSGGTFKKVRKYKTLVIPKIQIGSSHITFNQLSEGTFKTLALIFYIMTDTSSCLLIEEPEVCVHHGLLNKIISTVKAYSSSKQVIFSTHSDLVLDQLSPENVTVVTLNKGGTKTTPLEKWAAPEDQIALKEYLAESGTLGEYWRSGGLS